MIRMLVVRQSDQATRGRADRPRNRPLWRPMVRRLDQSEAKQPLESLDEAAERSLVRHADQPGRRGVTDAGSGPAKRP